MTMNLCNSVKSYNAYVQSLVTSPGGSEVECSPLDWEVVESKIYSQSGLCENNAGVRIVCVHGQESPFLHRQQTIKVSTLLHFIFYNFHHIGVIVQVINALI